MGWYPHRTPDFVKTLFPNFLFEVNNSNKEIYLTFDDGPDPVVTNYVLELLDQFQAKATFFLVGNRVPNEQPTVRKILSNGHAIGNHTNNHLNGWRTSSKEYLEDILMCQQRIKKYLPADQELLFRPPYGKILPSQWRKLGGMKVVMWSYLSGDFDQNLEIKRAKRALNNVKAGSVVVFHDSLKSFKNLKELLPWFMKRYSDQGFTFECL